MKHQIRLFCLVIFTLAAHGTASSNQQSAQKPLETRVTKLNNFLINNPRTEEENQQYHLHPAYYASEVANILYEANLHSTNLDINPFVDSLCTFASSLQSLDTQRDLSVFGSFQSYPNEKNEREQYTPSVADFYHGVKVCSVSQKITGFVGNVDPAGSISFLKNCVGGGVFRLHPRAEVASVVSLYYGTKAYNVLYDMFTSYRWQVSSITQDNNKIQNTLLSLLEEFESGSNPLYEIHLFLGTLDNIGTLSTFLKNLEADFKTRLLRAILERQDPVTGAFSSQPGRSPDLLSTYYAISSLKKLHPQQLNDAAQGNFLAWILQCQGPSGGFAPSPSYTSQPKWITTHAAVSILHQLNRLNYLEAFFPEDKSGISGFSIQSIKRAIENLDWNTVTSAQFVMPTLGFGALIIAMISLYSQPARQVTPTQKEEDTPKEVVEPSQEGKNVLPASPKQKTLTVIRDNASGEIVDKDGNEFSMDKKTMKNWEIVTERNTLDGSRTTFVLRYKK